MSISGTGFISTSTVYWNNALLSNAVYDSTTTEMVVPIPPSLVANVGIAEITVANPPPGIEPGFDGMVLPVPSAG
jgi:hypothetical protein